jgi:hypothetical protein
MMRWRTPVAAAVAAFALATVPAAAQLEVLTLATLIEPDQFPVPVVQYVRIDPSDNLWRLSVVGLTFGLEHQRPVRPAARLVTSAEITPARANASDRLYEWGERVEAAEFTNRQIDLRVGFDYERSDEWSTSVRLIGMANRVAGLPAEIEKQWRNPYAGVSIEQAFERQTAADPFRGTFEGVRLRAHAEVYLGDEMETWMRTLLAGEHAGHVGRFRFSESVTLFHGQSLNVVNRFLIGSSWRVPGLHPLYGFRYAEFRLDQGAALNAAVDYEVTERIDVGVRLSYLVGEFAETGVEARGVGLEAGTTIRGIAITVGAALPNQRKAIENDLTFYAMLSTALFLDVSDVLGDLGRTMRRRPPRGQ